MASIQKYKTKTKGTLYLFKAVTGHDADGKPITTTRRGFRTVADARKAARDFEILVETGGYIADSSITFAAVADAWLNYHKNEVKQSTIKSQQSKINTINTYLGNRKIKDIKRRNVEFVITDLLDNGDKKNTSKARKYKRSTVNNIYQVMKMVFKYALKNEYISIDPMQGVSMPKRVMTYEELTSEPKKIKFMTKDELLTFLDLVDQHSLDIERAYFYLLAYGGMRAGEALALKWEDIDFIKNTVRINKTLFTDGNSNKRFELNTPKTTSSIRTITIDKQIMNIMKQLQIMQKSRKLAYGKNYEEHQFVFAAPEGRPTPIGQMQRRLNQIEKYSGKHINLHMFRHTHTSLCIEAGMSIFELQKRLGHSDIQTTMNIYAHMTQKAEEISADKFNEFMAL